MLFLFVVYLSIRYEKAFIAVLYNNDNKKVSAVKYVCSFIE